MKSTLQLIVVAFAFCALTASQSIAASISGVINKYAPVVSVSSCSIKIAAGHGVFAPGERAIIIQMIGASVDLSNTSNFGTITDYGNSGNYEIVTIKSVNGNELILEKMLSRGYSPATAAVQLVSFPKYPDATVTGNVIAPDWDGFTGGVIAFEVTGTLTIDNTRIQCFGGFAGGDGDNGYIGDNCTDPNWVTVAQTGNNGAKGQGIAGLPQVYGGGMGPAANGGGGGNMHNAGGGGGGNGGQGGKGGSEWIICGANPLGGEGGRALPYNNGLNKIFMGGGGGKGQQNQGGSANGARGGGIIIIKAGRMSCVTGLITAIGGHCADISDSDGGGGGGAGGTILIDCPQIVGSLSLVACGGNGGNTRQNGTCVGPGAGGGGGAIWHSGSYLPSNVYASVDLGHCGFVSLGEPSCEGTSYGASNGSNGVIVPGLVLPESDIENATLEASPQLIDFGTLTCKDYEEFAAVLTNQSNKSVAISYIETLFSGKFSASTSSMSIPAHSSIRINIRFNVNASGPLYDTVYIYSSDLCESPIKIALKGDFVKYEFSAPDEVDLGISCDDVKKETKIQFRNLSPVKAAISAKITPEELFDLPYGEFSTQFEAGETRDITVAYKGGAGPGVYSGKLTYKDPCGIDKTVDVKIAVSGLKYNKKKDLIVCENSNAVTLNEEYFEITGGVGPIYYEWSQSTNLSNPSIKYPEILRFQNMTYTLTATDSLGCSVSMPLTVEIKEIPKIEFIPDALNFGEIPDCEEEIVKTLKIVNKGSSSSRLKFTMPAETYELLDSTEKTIEAGDTAEIRVKFYRGEKADVIVIAHMNVSTEAECGDFKIRLEGIIGGSTFTYSDSLDLGKLESCKDSVFDWAYINNNSKTNVIKLGKAFFERPGPFSCNLTNDVVTEVPTEWRFGYCIFMARGSAGVHENILNIPYEFGNCKDTMRIYVRGEIEPGIDVDWTERIDFGRTLTCDEEPIAFINLQNTGINKIDSIVIEPAPAVMTQYNPEYKNGLNPGDSFNIGVVFTQTTIGQTAGVIKIAVYAGDCRNIFDIPFQGERVEFNYVATKEIDFGSVPLCETAAIKKQISILARGLPPCLVKSITASGDFKLGDNFTIALIPGNEIGLDSEQQYECSFTPNGEGDYTGNLEIQLDACDTIIRIDLKAKVLNTGIIGLQSEIDFGIQDINTEAILIARYVNVGDIDLTIMDIPQPVSPFEITNIIPKLPCALKPGDTLFVECKFISPNTGEFESDLTFTAQPCDLVMHTPLRAAVLYGGAEVDVVIGKDSAYTGQKVVIPLKLITGIISPQKKSRYLATIKFNKTLLSPRFTTTVDSLGECERYCVIDGETNLTDTTLRELVFTAALGDSESTPITIVDFRWLDLNDVTTHRFDGEFQLLGVCREGSSRLYNGDGRISAPIIKPNPASGELEIAFTAIEEGRTTLKIFDISGKLVKTLYDDTPEDKKISIKTTVKDLPDGVYFVELKTPTQLLTTKLIVEK